MKKDVVAGLGEIGSPILKLFSKTETIVGADMTTRLSKTWQYKVKLSHEG